MPSKNYENISVKTSSSDDYLTFEKTYSFESIYRRIIGVGSLGDQLRGIICTEDIPTDIDEDYLDTANCFLLEDIAYVRIKNLHSSQDLQVHGYAAGIGSGEKIRIHVKAGEVFQLHSELKIGDVDTAPANWMYLALAGHDSGGNPAGGADIFVGCS